MSSDNPLSEDSKVIVRIWTSRNHPTTPGNNVGHISLETQILGHQEYMSFWPQPFTEAQKTQYHQAGTLEQQALNYLQERDGHLMCSYADDMTAEGGEPQATIVLYGLEPGSMVSEFEQLKTQVQHWRLLGVLGRSMAFG